MTFATFLLPITIGQTMWKRLVITCAAASFTIGCAGQRSGKIPTAGQIAPPQPAADQLPATTKPQSLAAAFFDRAAGPTSGWLIGAREELITQNQMDAAHRANDNAAQSPATVADAANSPDADLNHDGFVTLDEVLAMKRADLTDRQIIQRLQNTHQVFNLNARQQQYLLDRGIDRQVIDAIRSLKTGAGSTDYH